MYQSLFTVEVLSIVMALDVPVDLAGVMAALGYRFQPPYPMKLVDPTQKKSKRSHVTLENLAKN